jgi:hypothetical protein
MTLRFLGRGWRIAAHEQRSKDMSTVNDIVANYIAA